VQQRQRRPELLSHRNKCFALPSKSMCCRPSSGITSNYWLCCREFHILNGFLDHPFPSWDENLISGEEVPTWMTSNDVIWPGFLMSRFLFGKVEARRHNNGCCFALRCLRRVMWRQSKAQRTRTSKNFTQFWVWYYTYIQTLFNKNSCAVIKYLPICCYKPD
jgi:hypothetical protein